MIKCKVIGCTHKLDDHGKPIEFCEYQQGRCPMQKEKLDTVGRIVITSMFTTLLILLWLIT